MAQPLTADDLFPLVAKLSRDEQVRLAQLILQVARVDQDDAEERDAAAYRAMPVRPGEFSQAAAADVPCAGEDAGWEAVSASR